MTTYFVAEVCLLWFGVFCSDKVYNKVYFFYHKNDIYSIYSTSYVTRNNIIYLQPCINLVIEKIETFIVSSCILESFLKQY